MTSLRIRYQTLEFGGVTDIHIQTLRDNQEFSDDEGVAESLGISSASWPLFGVIWGSGELLAHLMFDYNIEGKRILEVGCGIALASLVLNHRHANITATDYHPEAGNFLLENTKLNHDKDIPFIRTGWADAETNLGKFDLIIGSDLLYEAEHVDMLATFINQHAAEHCEIVLIDPGRGQHARFSKKMVTLGYSHNQRKYDNNYELSKPLSAQILTYGR